VAPPAGCCGAPHQTCSRLAMDSCQPCFTERLSHAFRCSPCTSEDALGGMGGVGSFAAGAAASRHCRPKGWAAVSLHPLGVDFCCTGCTGCTGWKLSALSDQQDRCNVNTRTKGTGLVAKGWTGRVGAERWRGVVGRPVDLHSTCLPINPASPIYVFVSH